MRSDKLRWRRITEYSIESDAGYRVSRAGPAGARRYTAWAQSKWYAWEHMPIGHFDTSDEAKDACEKHRKAATPSRSAEFEKLRSLLSDRQTARRGTTSTRQITE